MLDCTKQTDFDTAVSPSLILLLTEVLSLNNKLSYSDESILCALSRLKLA